MLIPLNSNKTLNIKNSAATQNLHWAGVGGRAITEKTLSLGHGLAKSLPGCHFPKPHTPTIPVHHPMWRRLGGNALILISRVPWSSNPQDETNTKKSRHLGHPQSRSLEPRAA